MKYEDLKKRIHSCLLEELTYGENMEEGDLKNKIYDLIVREGKTYYLTLEEKTDLGKELYYLIRKHDFLEELLEDETITEIMINGTEAIFYEQEGRLYAWKKAFVSQERLQDIIQQIVAKCNRTVNEASPIVDARLEEGYRVNVVLPPVALNGPIVTIRKFFRQAITMQNLIDRGSISEEAVRFLKRLVICGYNIMISGGTGSGKTTFLNALSQYIPSEERVITIEDSAELQIQGIKNLVRLETRNANVEGCREITIRDLMKSALRMRGDRVVIGEVRGAEAIDLLQALNTGAAGSLSTGHSNSCYDMLYRLETMVLMGMQLPLYAIRRQIASGIDILVHLGRLKDKSRCVMEITEIQGIEGEEIVLNPLFILEERKGENGTIRNLVRKGELIHTQKWETRYVDEL